MMPGNPNNRPATAFNSLLEFAEPVSEEERKQCAEEWAKKRLDEIYYLAIGNEDIARALCEKAVECAYSNNDLNNMIKEKLKKKRGRPLKTLPNWLYLLHYAYEMRESNGNHEEARRKLIGYINNKNPKELRDELIKDMKPSLENRISEKVSAYRDGKIETPFDDNKLPSWAEAVIQTRITRGDKNKKRN